MTPLFALPVAEDWTMRNCLRSATLALTVVALWSAILRGQAGVRWDVGPQAWQEPSDVNVGPSDVDAILALARRAGVSTPGLVTFDLRTPGACPFLLVSSVVTEAGDRRTWRDITLYRTDWIYCSHPPESGAVYRRGRWMANAEDLSDREEWRIRDGDWYVDVVLQPPVAYDDARRIVRAIRRRAIVSRLQRPGAPLEYTPDVPDIDADHIAWISKGRGEPDMFDVRLGKRSGSIFTVKLVGDEVELHTIGVVMVREERPPGDDLELQRVLVAGACSQRYLQLWSGAA